MEGTRKVSKILEAMRKSSSDEVGINERLQAIDRGNLFPLPAPEQAREFEQLAHSLINLHDGGEGKTVVFASTYSGEGSSYVSYNCARYMTLLLNRKIAWVDGNFQRPHKKLDGLSLNFKDLMEDPQLLEGIGPDPELVVFGNGSRSVKPMNLLKGPKFLESLGRMQENFYFTIIDAPPIMESVEVAAMAQETLGMVLVIESQRLKYEVIQHGVEKMRNHNVKILGTVLNKREFQLPDFLYRRL